LRKGAALAEVTDHARNMVMYEYTLPRRELLKALAYPHDDTCGFMPWIEGGTRLHVPFHDIAGAQATNPQLHKQFARSDFGHGQRNDAYIVVAMILDS